MLGSSTSQKVTHTALDFVFFQKYQDEAQVARGRARADDPLVFKQEKADGDQVIYDQFGGGGLFSQRATEVSELPQSNPRVTNNVALDILEFSDAVDVPKNFADRKSVV